MTIAPRLHTTREEVRETVSGGPALLLGFVSDPARLLAVARTTMTTTWCASASGSACTMKTTDLTSLHRTVALLPFLLRVIPTWRGERG